MKTGLKIILMLLIFFAGLGSLFAADTATHSVSVTINTVSLIDVDDAILVALTTAAPAQGGQAVTGSTDSTKWLQYTSLTDGTARRITAQSAAPFTVAGVRIDLTAAAPVGGSGTLGTAQPTIILDNTAKDLVTGIQSCVTGTAANADGVQLTYALIIVTPGSMVVGSAQTEVVTYTLTDS